MSSVRPATPSVRATESETVLVSDIAITGVDGKLKALLEASLGAKPNFPYTVKDIQARGLTGARPAFALPAFDLPASALSPFALPACLPAALSPFALPACCPVRLCPACLPACICPVRLCPACLLPCPPLPCLPACICPVRLCPACLPGDHHLCCPVTTTSARILGPGGGPGPS